MQQLLEGYDAPAILVTKDYEILATNTEYQEKFGDINFDAQPKCYAVSHGYTKPCDQAGEDCPLKAALSSKQSERVLHIHQTSRGPEHVDVKMIPVFNHDEELSFFVELLKPVPLASGKALDKKVVGHSPAFTQLLKTATRVAQTDADVLLLGESGTGKELISSLIHLSSKRKDSPLVTLECSGLSETLFESELFGHKKGAFTGAYADKPGLVEQADGGTLFLDEIGEVSLEMQVKLLRLIESKTFRRVGCTQVRRSNFRLVTATHQNLVAMVEAGQFRLDLYHRINVFPIHVPALRERLEDLPELAAHLIRTNGHQHQMTESALQLLKAHEFKGNIRELRNILARAIILADSNVITKEIIQAAFDMDQLHTPAKSIPIINVTLDDNEKRYLEELLARCEDKAEAATIAGLSLRTLYRKIEKFGLDV